MMDMLKRFEYCGDELIPYIEKVLKMLHPDKRKEFLNNEFVQVISSDRPANGFQVRFNNKPAKSIIYINIHQIKQCVIKDGLTEEDYFVYAIAHEMGHHFAGKGESWLLEKESNDWLKKWGNGNFDELIKKIHYLAAIEEENGYARAYKWANEQDKEWLRGEFSHYLQLLDKKDLSAREENQIIDPLKSIVKQFPDLDEEDSHDANYLKGLAFGILKRVRELSEEKNPRKGE